MVIIGLVIFIFVDQFLKIFVYPPRNTETRLGGSTIMVNPQLQNIKGCSVVNAECLECLESCGTIFFLKSVLPRVMAKIN